MGGSERAAVLEHNAAVVQKTSLDQYNLQLGGNLMGKVNLEGNPIDCSWYDLAGEPDRIGNPDPVVVDDTTRTRCKPAEEEAKSLLDTLKENIAIVAGCGG